MLMVEWRWLPTLPPLPQCPRGRVSETPALFECLWSPQGIPFGRSSGSWFQTLEQEVKPHCLRLPDGTSGKIFSYVCYVCKNRFTFSFFANPIDQCAQILCNTATNDLHLSVYCYMWIQLQDHCNFFFKIFGPPRECCYAGNRPVHACLFQWSMLQYGNIATYFLCSNNCSYNLQLSFAQVNVSLSWNTHMHLESTQAGNKKGQVHITIWRCLHKSSPTVLP